jgi:glycosyltransferase involved in cell wall biosynthesis
MMPPVTAPPRVLLVGHDASATGAPAVALAWVRWAARTGAAEVQVRLDRGGPLVERFAAVAPTHVASAAERRLATAADAGLGARGAARARRRATWRARRRVGEGTTVVAASMASWRTAAAIAGPAPLVLWLHELDGVADRILPPAERAALLQQTRAVVAVSDRVADMVTERWGVDPHRVAIVPSFVDAPPTVPSSRTTDAAGAPEVVAVGSLVPRKGAEHVVGLVAMLRRSRPELRAAWVGGDLTTPYADLIATDVATAGLEGAFALPGEVPDVGPWWPADGVVVHLAREDPAPLVAIEAALRGIPVVTWDTGGAADLVRSAGLTDLVVAPGDLVAAADAVERLLADARARQAAGTALRDAAAVRVTARVAPALLAAFTDGAG